MMRTLLFAGVLAALAATDCLLAQDRMTPELLWRLQRVSDPQVSPDGSSVLYHVRGYELAENRGTTQIWLLDTSTGTSRVLTSVGSNFNGRWSSDGAHVAFLSTRTGSSQVHVIRTDGGEAKQITNHDGGVANMSWSPTGAHFAFTADVKLDPDVHDRHPDLPHAEVKIYDDLMVRHWDEWKDGTYRHLFVVAADGSGEPKDLLAGRRIDTPMKPFGGGEQIAWAPDGESLVFVARTSPEPQSSTNSDLFRIAVDGESEPRNLTDGMPGYEINPLFSPDGKTLAFESMARDGYESDRNRLMSMPAAGGKATDLTEGWDLSVVEFAWSPDNLGLFLTADARGARQIFALSAKGGTAPEALTSGRWHFASPSPVPGKAVLFALRQSTERPYELVRIERGSTTAAAGEPVTDLNGALYANLSLPKVEERWFDATDGEKIHSWVVYPPDFDPAKKWPMLTYCQGGPQSQVGQWFSYRWNFHLMAAQGYIVLGVNRRGLPGFGTKWNEQISRDWGGQAMQDLLSATDQMFEESFVDREHTAAIGASFGGYTTYWLMGHDQEDRFCAMISHCGVFNLESMYLSTEELFFVNWDLGGPFWRDESIRRDYERFSPHRFLANWDTPLLVIHGQKDFRVPLEQGLQAFTAAQELGVPSRFVYFPTESHWVLSPQNGVVWHREFFTWLDRWCKEGGAAGTKRTGAVVRPAKGSVAELDDVTNGGNKK